MSAEFDIPHQRVLFALYALGGFPYHVDWGPDPTKVGEQVTYTHWAFRPQGGVMLRVELLLRKGGDAGKGLSSLKALVERYLSRCEEGPGALLKPNYASVRVKVVVNTNNARIVGDEDLAILTPTGAELPRVQLGWWKLDWWRPKELALLSAETA